MKLKQPLLAVSIVYTAIIVYYSLFGEEELKTIPGEMLNIKEGFYVHLLAYLVMAILWRGAGAAMLISLILAVAIGGSLEVAQSFLPLRTASIMDFLGNSLGAFVGAVVVPKMMRKRFSLLS